MSDADVALLSLAAEQAFAANQAALTPSLPDFWSDWTIQGWITGTDTAFSVGRFKLAQRDVFYGWLLERKGEFVAAIRGTGSPLEWWIDSLWMPRRAHPVAGRVESGFWSVYQSMRIGKTPISQIHDWTNGKLTIVGHSLGAALATYLTFDVAQEAGSDVRGIFVASPHPGDKRFSAAFGKTAPNHVLYRNMRDVVPRVPVSVPFLIDYAAVPNVQELSAVKSGIRVQGGWGAQHHVFTYFALMQPDRLPWLRQQFGSRVGYLA